MRTLPPTVFVHVFLYNKDILFNNYQQ